MENLYLPLEASQLHNTLLILAISTKVMFWLLFYNEICQYLEDPHNLVNLYFPNDKCMMLQNYMCQKDPFKQIKTMDFNVVRYKIFVHMVSNSTCQLIFLKTTTCRLLVSKKSIHNYTKGY